MKVVLDACVLYPTVMREMLLGTAAAGLYRPLWSARILEEWARAAARGGAVAEAQARGEIALARAAWPDAEIAAAPGIEARLWLPDPADLHVLAVAVAGSADAILTLNARDFPRQALTDQGVVRLDPDGFMLSCTERAPDAVAAVAARVLDAARRHDPGWQLRPLLKKARLPRLARALG